MSTSLAQPSVDWNAIDTVFLDMDGTLLDLNFDNHFWREHVPVRYAERLGLSVAEAKADLLPRYARIEGTLEWYCVDHWSRELGLDIALLKQEVDHLIAVHPHVMDFLDALGSMGKRRVLVTNAHQKAIALKMERTRLAGHLERIICAHDLRTPKEAPGFWAQVHAVEPFDQDRTLFVDDSPVMLEAAQGYGFRWLLMVLKPDSSAPERPAGEFPAIRDFADLLPGMLTR
jgi:HAD superfamily hydrolase (TIGR01509 family)